MKILSPRAMASLVGCMTGIKAVHEHTAICVNTSLAVLAVDLASYQALGHQLVLEVPGVAMFLKHPTSEVRIELIQQGVTQHEAWLVQNQVEFETLNHRLAAHPDFNFEPKEFRLDHLWAKMFRHTDGGVVQIVWRQKPVYDSI